MARRQQLLDGIIKWSQRDRWADLFNEFAEQHLGPACHEMGIELPDLTGMVDPVEFTTLWTCVFEDLVSADLDGHNLAEDYLKRRGWKESAAARVMIRALRQSVMSLYEVSGIRPDEGFFLRDLVRGGEPFWVHEKRGTHQAKELDVLAARIVTINGRTEIGGVVLAFDRARIGDITRDLDRLAKASPEDLETAFARLAQRSGETMDGELALALEAIKSSKAGMTPDGMLSRCAFVFTEHWLCQTLERRTGRSRRSAEPVMASPPPPANDSQPGAEELQYDLFGDVAPKTRAQGRRR